MMKVFLVLTIAGVVYFIYDHKEGNAQKPAAGDLVSVDDTSGSAGNLGCTSLVAKVRERLTDPSFRIGRNSHFYLITTGGYSTSLEPRQIMDVPIPRRSSGGFGKGGAAKMQAFLANIATTCSKQPEAEGSAIFRSVDIALQLMRSRNCGPQRDCELLLISDGLENVNSTIYRYLTNANPKAVPPATLDLSVAQRSTWCGYEQVGEAGGGKNAQTIINRWSALFSRPVTMEPYCAAETTKQIAARRD